MAQDFIGVLEHSSMNSGLLELFAISTEGVDLLLYDKVIERRVITETSQSLAFQTTLYTKSFVGVTVALPMLPQHFICEFLSRVQAKATATCK